MTLLALLAVVASTLAGHPLTVECNVRQDPGVDGYVYLETGPIHLRPEHCVGLSMPEETRKHAYSALVLAHEIGHFVLNTYNEMKAECWGFNHIGEIAKLLGWDPVKTRRDARWWTFCGAK